MTDSGPKSTATPSSTLTLLARPYDHPDARVLQFALYREQVQLYGFADNPVGLDAEVFTPPRGGVFLVGFTSTGTPVACGGWLWLRPGLAEIKRMYVVPAARRFGHGKALLRALERDAARAGATEAVLETGVRNHAALALYVALGYRATGSYAAARNPEVNRALAKRLSEYATSPASAWDR
jgi:ribosomal protein S18 acetylase RimI-like enzyme